MTAFTFVRHGLCAETRALIFGADGPLDLASRPPAIDLPTPALRSPTMICARSCEALGVAAREDSRLRPFDYGDWSGRPLSAVDPDGLLAWRHDPDYDGHGGESVRGFCGRIARFLDAFAGEAYAVVTHAEVVRAAEVWWTGDEGTYWTGGATHLRPWGVAGFGA